MVLDISGSMGRVLLGKALGAIASYAQARDVPAARVVTRAICPSRRSPGGSASTGAAARCSSPASTCCSAPTTPRLGAPVLVITDGWCDVLRVRREHAYLIPWGARRPFTARGPVFRVR
ncbi:hypothetical protein GCM10027072_02240 [Streptomyces bullii]